MNTILSKNDTDLRSFLAWTVKRYNAIDFDLKKIFNNSEQYSGRTQYRIKADFDKGEIEVAAELFLLADKDFKKVNAGLLSKKTYEEDEVERILKQVIEKHGEENNIEFFEKEKTLKRNNEMRLKIKNRFNCEKDELSRDLTYRWNAMVKRLESFSNIVETLEDCDEKIHDASLRSCDWCRRCYGERSERQIKEDMIDKFEGLSVETINNAISSLNVLLKLKQEGINKQSIREKIHELVNDVVRYLAPRLVKNNKGHFPSKYYKVPGGKNTKGEDLNLYTLWKYGDLPS